MGVDVLADFDIAAGQSDDLTVFQNGLILGNTVQGHLMARIDVLPAQVLTVIDRKTFGNGLGSDTYIVVIAQPYYRNWIVYKFHSLPLTVTDIA
ncbi:hypothetical protein GCM10027040_04500 [Halomonas shantousis]